MNFDRNSIIGMALLVPLVIAYFYFTRQGQLELELKQKKIQDSLAALQPIVKDTAKVASPDTAVVVNANAGSFVQQGQTAEVRPVLENELVKITFSNKGGRPISVELKKYRGIDSQQVRLMAAPFNNLSYRINTAPNQTAFTDDLYFAGSEVSKDNEGNQSVSFDLADGEGKAIRHTYDLRPNEYMFRWQVAVKGSDQLFTNNTMNLVWQLQADQQERDIKSEKRETQLTLKGQDGFDYFTMSDGLSKTFEDGVKWLAIKQKFFNATIIAENKFNFAEVSCKVPDDSTRVVAQSTATLRTNLGAANTANLTFHLFVGPNEFKTLKKFDQDLEDMVNLGQGVYAFVKYINRGIVLPVFGFLHQYVPSLGLAIALLTIFIRLLTSPLIYSSYVSGAKTRALRPEIDALKAKYGDDQQAYSMEQMKLFRSAGVNPLGGCIPALLQIPIFFALYSFFNSNIDLRGETFWWSKDLSSYDSILTWGFNIPGIGSHLSLFTLLAVLTSLLISLYSMNMTPDQNNPVLKYMPYIFPIMLLGIFNGLPSSLTWYYTVSNVITLAMQFVIQTYIIDHNKILAQIEANKKKPREKSKWQERLEQMQETQKKVNELKAKTAKKK